MNSDLVKILTEKKYIWNLFRFKNQNYKCNHYSLSSNKKWIVLELTFKQEPEDRYESLIEDSEIILFHLESNTPEEEIGRFHYYYNYNSCADYEDESGTGYRWGEGEAILILKDDRVDLENTDLGTIKQLLKKY
ncbi:MAG: hypothetical protein KDK36_14670 [Leptospiraceae bacterium]|nr:hypothetical protein [Leptospiraceae bacterium]